MIRLEIMHTVVLRNILHMYLLIILKAFVLFINV